MEDAVDYSAEPETEEVPLPPETPDVPAVDEDGVPYLNRAKEAERKAQKVRDEYEAKMAEMARQYDERLSALYQPQTQEPDDNEYDEKTGLTYGQIKALKGQFRQDWEKELQQTQHQQMNTMANTNVNQQTAKAQSNPKYKDFFENEEFSQELSAELDKLDLNAAMRKDIVEEKIAIIRGRHFDELAKQREQMAYRRAQENRHIAGEYALSKPTVASGGRQFKVTPDVEEYAKISGLSLEHAAESYWKRQERKGGQVNG